MLSIAIKNIKNRKGRSAAILILTAFLAFSIFAGTVIVQSLRNGFQSLEDRLGADIMVVPYEATAKKDLSNILLQGNTGYFYMDGDNLDKISTIPGISQISAQYYLASVKAGCCSIPVQIIGYDPETDFTITPWIRKSSGKEVGYLDVVVGHDLNAFVGETMSFYDVKVNVVAKLDKTGTAYDTEVFCTRDTVRKLIEASLNKKLNEYSNINSGNVISCILINVDDNTPVDEVLNNINIHYKKVRAIRTKNMISGISDSLSGVSKVAGTLSAVIWVIACAVLIAAFVMVTGERKKEFAVMRAMGASRQKLSAIVLAEGIGLSLAGGVIGIGAGLLVLLSFPDLVEARLGLPYLLPSAGSIILAALLAVLATVVSGALSSAVSAGRIAKLDTGTILRSGE